MENSPWQRRRDELLGAFTLFRKRITQPDPKELLVKRMDVLCCYVVTYTLIVYDTKAKFVCISNSNNNSNFNNHHAGRVQVASYDVLDCKASTYEKLSAEMVSDSFMLE